MSKFIIGIVGESGAGKETTIRILTELIRPRTVLHLSTSGFLAQGLEYWKLPKTRTNLQTLAIAMDDHFGDGTLTRAIQSHAEESPADVVVYDCIRFHSDMELVRSFKKNLVIYVTADQKVRWQRTKSRAEKPGENETTFKQFQKSETRATETSIKEFGKKADIKIVNDGSIMELKKSLAAHIKDIF